METPKILFKLPSRGRPERFFASLDSLVLNIRDDENYWISCNLDLDDAVMNTEEVRERISKYRNTSIEWGYSVSKIHAVNRSTPDYPFDIIAVHSDDMYWQFYGFDDIIRLQFVEDENFDKLIHIPEPDAKDMLATYYIAGKAFYNRFGFVYDPRFKSLWCDNLVMDLAKHVGAYRYVNCPGMLFHSNPCYGHHPKDAMFIAQQNDWGYDEMVYKSIRNRGYEYYFSDLEAKK